MTQEPQQGTLATRRGLLAGVGLVGLAGAVTACGAAGSAGSRSLPIEVTGSSIALR